MQSRTVHGVIKGGRGMKRRAQKIDFSELSDKEVSRLLEYCEGWPVELNAAQQAIFESNSRSAIILSCASEVRVRARVGRLRVSRDADQVFDKQPVLLQTDKSGTQFNDVEGNKIARSSANVLVQKEDDGDNVMLLKKRFATRANAVLKVVDVGGVAAVRTQVPKLNAELSMIDNSAGAIGLLSLFTSVDKVGPDVIYDVTMEADMGIVAGGTQVFYEDAPSVIFDALGTVKFGEDDFYFPNRVKKIGMQQSNDEIAAKQMIKLMSSVFAGSKRGPGRYCASHMDGIPFTPSMRRKFNCVTDVVDVKADVYYIDESDPILINAMRVLLAPRSRNVGIFYRSKQPLKYAVLADHAACSRGVISKVDSSFCLPGNSWPVCTGELKSCYITFQLPSPAVGNTLVAAIDNARYNHQVRVEGACMYSVIQCYIDYRALSFPADFRGKSDIRLNNATARWSEDEMYHGSTLMGSGYAWYVSGGGEYDAKTMANAIASACFHRIRYLNVCIPQREFGSVAVVPKAVYDLSRATIKDRMPYLVLGDATGYVPIMSQEEVLLMKSKYSAVSASVPIVCDDEVLVEPENDVKIIKAEEEGGRFIQPPAYEAADLDI
jgi:hypothetical protein